jgi:hypothetical protein
VPIHSRLQGGAFSAHTGKVIIKKWDNTMMEMKGVAAFLIAKFIAQ